MENGHLMDDEWMINVGKTNIDHPFGNGVCKLFSGGRFVNVSQALLEKLFDNHLLIYCFLRKLWATDWRYWYQWCVH